MNKLLVCALEPSANLHLKPILDRTQNCEIMGIFDERFGRPIVSSSEFSVMGFLDIFSKLSLARRTIKELAKMSLEASHVLLIDSPAFNLPLSYEIRKINKNVPITWYVLPKVWAWRKGRAKKVEKYCTNLASIFPFEDKFYARAHYVGNPLLDEIKYCKAEFIDTNRVVFMPGSRKSEIKGLIEVFKEVARNIKKRKTIVIPDHFTSSQIEELYGDLSGFEISRSAHDALLEAEFAFICSGTATLEAALIGTPFVLCYKAKKLDYFIARRFVKLKYSGLANIIFDFAHLPPLHKEFFQDDVNAKNLLREYRTMDRVLFFERAKSLKTILKHGSAQAVAKIIGV